MITVILDTIMLQFVGMLTGLFLPCAVIIFSTVAILVVAALAEVPGVFTGVLYVSVRSVGVPAVVVLQMQCIRMCAQDKTRVNQLPGSDAYITLSLN